MHNPAAATAAAEMSFHREMCLIRDLVLIVNHASWGGIAVEDVQDVAEQLVPQGRPDIGAALRLRYHRAKQRSPARNAVE